MAKNETPLIIRLREDVTKLRADQARTRKLMQGHRRQMQGIGKQMATTLSSYFGAYAVISGISKAVSSIATFEKGMSKVRAVSGATDKQFDALKANALELGRISKFTAGEISVLELELSKLGFTPEKIIQSTDAIRELATVADAELGESAKTLAGTLNSFNLSATESERVANVMAESFSKSALDMEKFTVATANSGAIANVLGVTLEQNTARVGALVDANIDASKAGTDLRKIYLELNKAGISYDQAMQKILSSSDKAGTAQKLFGIRAAGAAVILAQQQTKVNELTSELSDSNRELGTMVDIMEDNLITDWEKFTSAIDGAIQKGSAFNDFARVVVRGLTNVVNALSDFQDMDAAKRTGAESIKESLEGLEVSSESVKGLQIALAGYDRAVNMSIQKSIEFKAAQDEVFKDTKRTAAQFAFEEETLKQLNLETSEFVGMQEAVKAKLDAVTQALKDQIQAEKDAIEVKRKLREISSAGAGLGGFSSINEFSEDGGVGIDMQGLSPDAIAGSTEEIVRELAIQREMVMAEMENFSKQLNKIIETEIEGAFVGMADAIGSAIGDGSGIENIFDAMIGIIVSGMRAIGIAMIAEGVALEVMKEALENWNGVALVAAGAALVGAAAVVSSAIGSASSPSGSSGGGGGYSGGAPQRSFDTSVTGQTLDLNLSLESRVDGNDIVLSYDNSKERNNRAVG